MRNLILTLIKVITKIDPDKTYILCCTDMNSVIKYKDKDLENVLILEFVDTTINNHPGRFTEKQAEQIRSIVLKNEKDIIVACEVGISRSPAIVAALLRWFHQDDMVIWSDSRFSPNTLVYSTLARSMGVPVSSEEVAQLKKINENAFYDAKQNSMNEDNNEVYSNDNE